MSVEQIRGLFAFGEQDLIANRTGKLSAKQIKRFVEVDQFAERFVLGMFLVFLVGTLILGYLAISARNSIGLWIGMVVLLLLTAWAFRGVRTKVDNSVQKAQGEVTFVKVEKQTGSATAPSSQRMTVSSYEMQVGGEAFSNANPALIEYMQGNVYTVYFTKATRQILSAELISKGK